MDSSDEGIRSVVRRSVKIASHREITKDRYWQQLISILSKELIQIYIIYKYVFFDDNNICMIFLRDISEESIQFVSYVLTFPHHGCSNDPTLLRPTCYTGVWNTFIGFDDDSDDVQLNRLQRKVLQNLFSRWIMQTSQYDISKKKNLQIIEAIDIIVIEHFIITLIFRAIN
jgi:hypothetical protein